ncbi:MAG: HEAT repeat domain-containing protein [Methanothrix sp.]|nr:HEAT repeat domain-containing protein [Methanothrix sp.]
MPDRIFISYCHQDGDFADYLAAKLEQNGFEHWLDIMELKGGDEWREEIDRAIRDSSALILIVTPESRNSNEVTCEWVFALGAGLKVIPIMLHETQVHPRLNKIHYYDFTKRGARPLDKLMADLKAICEKEPKGKRDINPAIKQASSIEISVNCPPFIENAIKSLDSVNLDERKDAIDLLIQNDQPLSRGALLSALKKHPLNDVRRGIAHRLGESGYIYGMPGLIEALRDHDNSVREQAAWALGIIGDNTSSSGLMEALGDPDNIVRMYAAEALGKIGSKDAVPKLIEALKDPEKSVRGNAADALGRIGDKDAIPALEQLLNDNETLVRKEASQALEKFNRRSDAKEQN